MIQMLLPEQKSGGVYDYACRLQEKLGPGAVELVHLSRGSAASWRPAEHVWLHYVGYGYERRGTPIWLLDLLARQRPLIRRFGVVFHELYADGPPWTSAFWLSPLQQHIARRLASLCDAWIATRQQAAAWLAPIAGGKPHSVLPCFSTIGEGARATGAREPHIVVFGTPGLRVETYRASGEALFDWAERQALEVHDIGPPMSDATVSALLARRGARQHGRLEVGEIRERLGRARFGVVTYPLAFAAKSSIVAAYAAHGLCPIIVSDDAAAADGLVSGVNFLPSIPRGELPLRVEHAIAGKASAWYAGHSLACHAAAIETPSASPPHDEARRPC